MNYILSILILTTCINASEYKYIKPIAVEIAPVKKAIVKSAPLDDDSDGVLNHKDKCPNTKSGEKVDKDGCLIKQDLDYDGVPDEDDECPDTMIGVEVDYKGCELDSDDDGVVDSKDRCPDTSRDFVVDEYGCPKTATLKATFGSSMYNISDKLLSDLEEFSLFLKENRAYQVIIYGYTDSIGSVESNKVLSQNRANAVKEALKRHGIRRTRLTAIGRGEADPVADNADREGRAINRRIEVELLE